MESSPYQKTKGGLFPSASAIKTISGNEAAEFDWLSNQSFDPTIAQARAHRHGESDVFSYKKQENTATVHHQRESSHSHQSLSTIVPPHPMVKEELPVIPDQNDSLGTASESIKVEQDKGYEPLHADQSDSDSVSSDEHFYGNDEDVASKVKKENVPFDLPARDKKQRSKEDSHRPKKSKKRHHKWDSSPERDSRKLKKKKSKHKDEKNIRHKDDREKKRKHNDDKEKKKHKGDGEKSSKEYKSHNSRPSSIWIDDIGFIPETPFYVDEKSDRNNLCFKSLHHTDLAFYQRLGKSCLGLDSDKEMVTWGDAKNKKKGKKHFGNAKRYFDQVCPVDEVERVPIADKKQSESRGMDFTPATNNAQMPFIPLKPMTDSNSNAEIKKVQDTSESGKSGLSEAVATYNKHLQEHPGDIEKWLEFVRFQDQAFQSTNSQVMDDHNSTMHIKTSKREHFINEKKLSILEKALKMNPLNAELQLEQIEICRETWELNKLSRQWDSIIRQHSENIAMWKQYLAFKQSSFSKFTVSDIASVYTKYLEAMEAQDTAVKLDIVMQMCHFWRQSGHTEKAVALLQALVEFNCFCPEKVKESTTLEGKIAFFEPFLDSNEPRFGQPGAKGWAKWVEQKEKGGWSSQSSDVKNKDEDDNVINKTHAEWQAWLEEEVHRERIHFIPWQPSGGETEDDCDDPERMVLVDDITPFLITIDSLDLKFELILHFLDFLGVRKQGQLSCMHRISTETMEHPAEVFGFMSKCFSRGHGGIVMSGERMPDLSQFRSLDKKSLVSGGGYEEKKAVLSFADDIIAQAIPLFPQEAKKHLTLLQMQYNLQRVDPCASLKQQKKQQKDGQKYAKRLLGQECNRNNLSLWEEYAKWEWHNGNVVERQRIFEMALAFSNLNLAAEEDNQEGICKLLSTYALLKLGILPSNPVADCKKGVASSAHSTCKQEVLHALTTLGEGGKFTPLPAIPDKHVSAGRILKARKGYVELFKNATDSSRDSIHSCHVRLFTCLDQEGSQLVHIALCYALFQYLSVGMQAAGVVCEETLSHWDGLVHHVNSTMDDVDKGIVHQQLDVDAELTMLFYTQVVSHHVHSHPMPVTSLRNLMQRALRRYCRNPSLLECLIDLEARSHIAGRLRRYFDKATSDSNDPIPWLYAIYAELVRLHKVEGEYSGKETGITNRLRSLFDRALSNRYTRHCVLLWRLYILFEVQNGDPKRGKAIFYRALQHCPWAKILYLDAVRYFPEELQEVIDLLMEKELRVRAPLEEIQLLMKVAQNKKE
nr:nuclear exosome regulator NRDE2-like [Lytechinus pictus]